MADLKKVEDMLHSLLIDRGGAATWEQDEHDWLDNLTMKQMTSLVVDNTKLTLYPIPSGGQKCVNCARWIVET